MSVRRGGSGKADFGGVAGCYGEKSNAAWNKISHLEASDGILDKRLLAWSASGKWNVSGIAWSSLTFRWCGQLAHMDVVAESANAVLHRRKRIKGLDIVYEPKYLRFFQARFERL